MGDLGSVKCDILQLDICGLQKIRVEINEYVPLDNLKEYRALAEDEGSRFFLQVPL